MTRRQLLANVDSRELTLWQAYLTADAIHQEERREQAKKEAELKQWVNEV
jgi:hypothetical protein